MKLLLGQIGQDGIPVFYLEIGFYTKVEHNICGLLVKIHLKGDQFGGPVAKELLGLGLGSKAHRGNIQFVDITKGSLLIQ